MKSLERYMSDAATWDKATVVKAYYALLVCKESKSYDTIRMQELLKTYPYLKGVGKGVKLTAQIERILGTSNSPEQEDTESEEKPYQVKLANKFLQLHRSAVNRGKSFNLTLKDVHLLLQQQTCFYTGEAFIEEDKNYKRTVDRVDHTKGYVRGNVVACTSLANSLKEHIFERPTQDLGSNVDFVYRVATKVLSYTGELE